MLNVDSAEKPHFSKRSDFRNHQNTPIIQEKSSITDSGESSA
jgi:hypothetical protein